MELSFTCILQIVDQDYFFYLVGRCNGRICRVHISKAVDCHAVVLLEDRLFRLGV